MRQRLAVAIIAGLVIAGLQMGRAADPSPRAQLVSVTRWQIPSGWFGGFSALELSEDGTSMTTVSDRGHLVRARLQRTETMLTGVTHPEAYRVLNRQGRYARKPGLRDSEGLVVMPDGSMIISFEGDHRIAHYTAPGAPARPLPRSAAFDTMRPNGGFEALAMDARGRLWAFPETPIGADHQLHVFRLENGTWRQPMILPRAKRFQPVGADFGPDGRLYLLERGFNGIGFRMRVRSFALAGDRLTDETLVIQRPVGVHDNLEGLSVWRDALGRIRLTMISDDNFRLLQRTEIVEYAITENT